jgi:hypothetical protein
VRALTGMVFDSPGFRRSQAEARFCAVLTKFVVYYNKEAAMSQAISQEKQTQESARVAGAVVIVCIVCWLLGSATESHSDGTEQRAKAPSRHTTADLGAPGRRF